jgi:hypothetical protein
MLGLGISSLLTLVLRWPAQSLSVLALVATVQLWQPAHDTVYSTASYAKASIEDVGAGIENAITGKLITAAIAETPSRETKRDTVLCEIPETGDIAYSGKQMSFRLTE